MNDMSVIGGNMEYSEFQQIEKDYHTKFETYNRRKKNFLNGTSNSTTAWKSVE